MPDSANIAENAGDMGIWALGEEQAGTPERNMMKLGIMFVDVFHMHFNSS